MLFRMRQMRKLAALAAIVWTLPIAGHATTPALSVGKGHSLALSTDGSVLAWGDDSIAFRSQPVRARALSRVRMACGGESYSAALDLDGAVWAWGAQPTLGTGSQEATAVPALVPGLTGIRALACGSGHILALRQDGKVVAWGANDEGQLGDGSRTQRLTPVEIAGLSNVKAIAAGNSFSAALKNDGTVWEWGVVLPFDTPRGMPRVVPVQTTGLSDVVSLYGGEVSFGLITIHADGQSWSRWITGTPPVRQVAEGALAGASAGYGLTLLQRVDDSVLSYGFSGNGFGSLGDGTTNYRDVPGPVVDIGNIVDVAAGTWHGSCAGYLRASLELDTSGQLGRGRI